MDKIVDAIKVAAILILFAFAVIIGCVLILEFLQMV
jgi:hypothetical protein